MRPSLCIAFAVLLASLAGCGADPYEAATVTGRVTTCEGKPATGGVVTFTPFDAPDKTGRDPGNPGPNSTGTVGEDGSFSLVTDARMGRASTEGALIGPHRVTFQMPPTTKPTIDQESRAVMSPEEIKEWDEKLATMPVYEPLPCKAEIAPGEVEVEAGGSTFEFTLPPK